MHDAVRNFPVPYRTVLFVWCCDVVAGNEVTEDDIHLIMEYKKGDKWGKYKAPRSNRSDIPLLPCIEVF